MDRLSSLAVLVTLLAACSGEVDEPARTLHQRTQAAAQPGPWDIPASIIAAGEAQYVPYNGAPAWDGGASCSGGLLPGARELGDYLLANFSGTCQIQGYNCRQNSASPSLMSVHGTGRAIDVIIPTVGGSSACFDAGGQADNDKGDPIGNWLIEHAEEIGVQYIIWDWWTWAGNRTPPKDRLYCGMDASRCHPHHNHLHVELTIAGANRQTPWFTERCSDGGCDTEDDPEPTCVPTPVAGAEDEVFADVAPSSFGYEAINLLWNAGITNGCRNEPRMYCPSCGVDRYAFVVFLLRAAEIDISGAPATPTFDDVSPSDWFYPYVEAAAREGITTGCGGGNFCPHDPVTRGQAAAFITRTLGWPLENPTTPSFDDVPTGYLFYRAIETIYDWCVTNGCGSGNYCPEDALTRAQAAIFVARAFDLEGFNACIEECDADACAAQTWCEPWSSCGDFADACDETGTQSRTCHDFACEGTVQFQLCEETLDGESQGCSRETDCSEPAADEPPDAGGADASEPDAGPDPEDAALDDSPVAEDAGTDSALPDAPGSLPDVTSDGEAASEVGVDAGCACGTATRSIDTAFIGLLALLTLALIRRRSRT